MLVSRPLALLSLALVLLFTRQAEAHRNGIQVDGCGGCHRSNSMSTLTLAADRDPILPGDLVNFTATISYTGVQVGGIYVPAPDSGDLGAGPGLTLSGGALTHSMPKAAVGGSVTFQFTWQAPATPGAVLLKAYDVAGNGNNQDTGDAPGEGSLEFAYGCEGQRFYFDADGDGYGAMAADTVLGCANQPPTGYSARGDDCDDAHNWVHPDAPERCNGQDDNCNGQIDENTAPELLYPDPDGDGYYGANPGDPVMGCLPLAGYADQPGDCAPTDGTKFPGAVEVCNYFDDNCDGRIDENVRPHCGLGRCEKESPTCDLKDCYPPAPIDEVCNGLDDNCDGTVDEGDLCPVGSSCLGIKCVVVDPSAASAAGTGTMSAGGTGQMSNGGSSGGAGGTTNGSSATGNNGAVAATGGSAAEAPAVRVAKQGGCGITPNAAGRFGLLWSALLVFARRRRRSGVRPE